MGREEPFRMLDGSEEFMKKNDILILAEILAKEKKKTDKFRE